MPHPFPLSFHYLGSFEGFFVDRFWHPQRTNIFGKLAEFVKQFIPLVVSLAVVAFITFSSFLTWKSNIDDFFKVLLNRLKTLDCTFS